MFSSEKIINNKVKGIEGRSQKGEVPFPIIVIAHTHGDLFGSGECSNTKRSPQHRKDCHHAKRKSGKGNKSSSETCLPSVKHAEKKKLNRAARNTKECLRPTIQRQRLWRELCQRICTLHSRKLAPEEKSTEGSSEFGQVFL